MSEARGAKPLFRLAVEFGLWTAALGLLVAHSGVVPRLLHAEANALFEAVASRPIELASVNPDSRADRSDTAMRGYSAPGSEPRWRAMFSLKRHGAWPLAAWLGAILATPISGRRRLREIGVGALALNLFVLAELGGLAALAFAVTDAPESGWGAALALARALFNSPVPVYSLLFALWVSRVRPAARISAPRFAVFRGASDPESS